MDSKTREKLIEEVEADLQAAKGQVSQLEILLGFLCSKREPGQNGEDSARRAQIAQTEPPIKDVQPAATCSPARVRRFEDLTHLDAAEMVLRDRGGPMQTAEIARQMIARGVVADFKRLRKSLFTSLSRQPNRFQSLSPGVWALVN